jgi:curli biogenesis system outer membrane secretion channel CsgG
MTYRYVLGSLLTLSLVACVPTSSATLTPTATSVATTPIPATGQVSIAIGELSCKAAKCYNGLGAGISEGLTTALIETGRFSVFEREGLRALTEESFFGGGSGPVSFEGADVLVFGAITAFEPDASAGGFSLMGISLVQKTSTISADLRIVDAKTRRILSVARVEGKTTDSSVSISRIIPGTIAGSSSESTSKAIRAMLEQAVQGLMARIPASYYR